VNVALLDQYNIYYLNVTIGRCGYYDNDNIQWPEIMSLKSTIHRLHIFYNDVIRTRKLNYPTVTDLYLRRDVFRRRLVQIIIISYGHLTCSRWWIFNDACQVANEWSHHYIILLWFESEREKLLIELIWNVH